MVALAVVVAVAVAVAGGFTGGTTGQQIDSISVPFRVGFANFPPQITVSNPARAAVLRSSAVRAGATSARYLLVARKL